MIKKRTALIQTEVPEGRNVIAYFMCVVEECGTEISRSNPHIVNFMPDADHAAILVAVNADLVKMGWAEIPAEEWARATGHCEVEHTPEVKAAYELFKLGKLQAEV